MLREAKIKKQKKEEAEKQNIVSTSEAEKQNKLFQHQTIFFFFDVFILQVV